MNEHIKLGSLVMDLATGFTGVATSRVESINQLPRIGVTAFGLVEGKPVEEQWFPEGGLRVLNEAELARMQNDFERTRKDQA